MPPPCTSSAIGAITQQGITNGITKSGFSISGTLAGYMAGHSATGCNPYRTRFNFVIVYDMVITRKYYSDRHDSSPDVDVVHFDQQLDLGWTDGAGNIGSDVDYTSTGANQPVTLPGGSGNPPINFQTIFDGLSAYHSDSVPTVDNVPYTTYELTTVAFYPFMDDQLGHGSPFAPDTEANMSGANDYLPA